MRQIYDTVTTQLKERDPKLLQHLFKELGWGLGYEVRERRFILDEKIKATFQTGMLVCLRLGLDNLATSSKDDKGKKYSLLLADTFIVTEDGAECITEGAFSPSFPIYLPSLPAFFTSFMYSNGCRMRSSCIALIA